MGAEPGILLENIECSSEVIDCCANQGRLRCMQRNVEMDPPFAVELGSIAFRGRQRLVQIGVPDQFPIGPSFDHLMEIDAIVERGEGGPDLVCGMNPERVAQVDLADPDPATMQSLERLSRGLELEGEMTGVVVDAQMLTESEITWSIRLELSEERDELSRVLDSSERLGLQSQVQLPAGLAC